jgi:uncharacterized protein YbjT (DUF2867 family)
MTSILVTGGTGTLGRLLSDRLREHGHEVRVLSRHTKPYTVDLRDGSGLDAAAEGDSGEVAGRLAELAVGAPAGRVDDMGGPQIRPPADLARAYLHATGRRRPIVPVRLAGKAYGCRSGAQLTPEQAVGKVTFEDFLAQRLG